VDATPHINKFQVCPSLPNHPSAGCPKTSTPSPWQIGFETINLDDVSEITRFSVQFCQWCAVGMLAGTVPLSLITLFSGLAHTYFPIYRVIR
jgi:hypothetical protein